MTRSEANANIMVTFHLPPLLADVFEAMINNKFITDAQIAVLHPRADVEKAPVRMTIYRLRDALKPYNIEIYNDRKAGYWLTQDAKATIKALLASEVVPHIKSPNEETPEKEIPNEVT